MNAEILIAFGSIFTAVSGFIIAVYTMRTSANKEFVKSLQDQLDKEIKLRQDERKDFDARLLKVENERDELEKQIEVEREKRREEQVQWQKERAILVQEIETLKRRLDQRQRRNNNRKDAQ